MKKSISAHWRGEQGFWQTCLLNGIGGFCVAFIAAFLLAILVIPIQFLLIRFGIKIDLKTPLILCVFIPFIICFLWTNVGMFRFGIRTLNADNANLLEKSGGVFALILMAIFIFGFFQTGSTFMSKVSNTKFPGYSSQNNSNSNASYAAIMQQISQCWNIPSNLTAAQKVPVEIMIDMNPDRTLKSAKVVDQDRYSRDKDFKLIADTVLQAIKNPRCNEFNLPATDYDEWKQIDATFDPN